jgi:hypothetical protein
LFVFGGVSLSVCCCFFFPVWTMGSLARLARISTLAGSATLMSMEATVFYSRNDGPASESQKVLLTFGYLTENCACDFCAVCIFSSFLKCSYRGFC